MPLVDIASILDGKHDGEKVIIRGWMYNHRSSGGIQFLMVRDGSGVIQCTLPRDRVSEETYRRVEKLPLESVVELRGVVRVDERAPNGRELSITEVVNLWEAQPGYPITRKRHGVDFLLDHRHLYIRDPKMQAILRIRSKVLEAARDWLRGHGYT